MRLNKEGERGAGASPYLSVVVGRSGRPLGARGGQVAVEVLVWCEVRARSYV